MLSESLLKIWDGHNEKAWDDRRREILAVLSEEEYGYRPENPESLTWETVSADEKFCAGKVCLKKVSLTARMKNGDFSFPVYAAIPKGSGKFPFFVHINFRDCVPDKYMPTEEICDNGFAVLSFCYTDITSDDGDFGNGLAGVVFNGKKRGKNDCGKIAMWSWAASRVMDYAQTLDSLDSERGTVIGHSRLGKTALLTGALDDRFYCAVSNNSGCSGAAISRNKRGETIKDIGRKFPYWFCENYQKYAEREDEMPFDQHFLLGAIAPRRVYVASAQEDLWADPASEYRACAAADEVYKKMGLKGFLGGGKLPEAGDVLHGGEIAYHLRKGTHYLSREDWGHFIAYLKK